MEHQLFNRERISLHPTNEKTVKVVVGLAKEIGFTGLGTTASGGLSLSFPIYYVEDGRMGRTNLDRKSDRRSLNEWVTELYKYKKSKDKNK